MDAIDRRGALRTLLCGAVAAGLGASLLPGPTEAVPLAMKKDPGGKLDDFRHETQAVVGRPPSRRWRRHRGRRRRVCWWHHGRRVCRWR